jgi:hypothetical protein
VGHRALIAYRRPDELYNCHYSHWGGLKLRLKQSVTSETPFGGEASDSDVQAYFRSSLRATENEQFEPPTAPSAGVDLAPFEVGVTLDSILSQQLNFLSHEAFYVVEEDFDVTAYRTLWFGLQHESRTIEEGATMGNGALATVRWYDGEPVGDGAFCGQFAALKDVVGDMIDRDVLDEQSARRYMIKKLRSWIQYDCELKLTRLLKTDLMNRS